MLSVQGNDTPFINLASGAAQRAVDTILGRQDIDTKEEVIESLDESVVS